MLHGGLVFDPIIVGQYYDKDENDGNNDNDIDNAEDETGQHWSYC